MDVWLLQSIVINTHRGECGLDGIARETNNAFDKVFVNVEGIVKDDDVSTLRLLKEVHGFVNQDVLIGMKIRLHTLSIRAKALCGKADDEEYEEREGNHFNCLTDETGMLF